jgi:hypothetical protein
MSTSISDAQVLLRLGVVLVLCGAIGLEREARDDVAGLRTHVTVGLGAALFTLAGAHAFASSGSSRVDPTRVAAQVVSGIGFLGAGAILRHGATVRGVTTAAALWISAAIGMATAAGVYFGTVATTALGAGHPEEIEASGLSATGRRRPGGPTAAAQSAMTRALGRFAPRRALPPRSLLHKRVLTTQSCGAQSTLMEAAGWPPRLFRSVTA